MYQYNPKLHVKIWLSNNPNVFMNLENQIRLIEMREKNPDDTIHLVYESTLLTQTSINALREFCREHRIVFIDANAIHSSLQSYNEKKLYEFYKDEICNLKAGGNLAVASDILRWLSPIFKKGTYTDFDFPVDTSHLPKLIPTEMPILLNIGSLKIRSKEFILANNDFVAIVDAIAAAKDIERVQSGLIARLSHYDTDFIERTETELSKDSFINRYLLKFMKNRSESLYIAKSKEIIPPDTSNSSLNIRKYINEVMTDKNKFLDFNKVYPQETHMEVIKRLRNDLHAQLNLVKYLFFNKEYSLIKRILEKKDDKFLSYLMQKERDLYLKSIVVCTTGPIQISNALFDGYVVSADKFIKDIQPHSFNHYGLQNAFCSQNSIPLHENVLGMLKFLGVDEGELNDSSWLDSGKKLQTSRTKLLVARQKELALSLPTTFSIIRSDVEEYIQKVTPIPSPSVSREKNYPKIADLKLILSCFNKKNEFNILQFKKILINIQEHKQDEYTQKLVEELEKLSHDAVIFSLAKNKKIKLALPDYRLPQSSPPHLRKKIKGISQYMHNLITWPK
ncbi:putative glucosyltransferase Lgt1 [Legionella steigerwaltii]|uniref:Glucosyltransferase Lgt1 n=1 Tax=Legionella steigerwaltii TaxID=460 RepID=A0A378LFW9_9GAMM|nr:glycosyltransferase family 88 protein [Legionella steigerwaltii]KTD77671.1 putative glucosyltransferase Lgt1 [Legionella steigerwaltii]STY22981.1 putative glucosyltransferase Lgt1 [Legionella steigerwaltii]